MSKWRYLWRGRGDGDDDGTESAGGNDGCLGREAVSLKGDGDGIGVGRSRNGDLFWGMDGTVSELACRNGVIFRGGGAGTVTKLACRNGGISRGGWGRRR